MDLEAFMRDMLQKDISHIESSAPVSRRKRASVEELQARLDYYQKHNPDFEVTSEHLEILQSIFGEHRNTLITGGAGVGKTAFVRTVLIPELDHRNMHWAVTATTGIAGSHLDGKTMHSFFGIGLGPDWPEIYPRKMSEYLEGISPGDPVPRPPDMSVEERNAWYRMFYDVWLNGPKVKKGQRSGVMARLRSHEVVLIDEVSMMHGDAMLGYLDFMLKEIRGSSAPFGGLQLVFIGDFAQLPPVEEGGDPDKADWAFMSRAWDEGRVKCIELTKVFRQGDQRFIQFLNNIRSGQLTPDDRQYASTFVRTDMTMEETKHYTFLVPTNDQARRINLATLEQYEGPTLPLNAEFYVYPELQRMKDWEARDIGKVKEELTKAMGRRLLSPRHFVRIGYPVMFTVNDHVEGQFVNGTRGFVREVNINPRSDEVGWDDTDNVVVGIPGRKEGDPERLVTLTRWAYSREREQDSKEQVAVGAEWNATPGNTKLPEYISMYPTVKQFPLIPAVAITIHKAQGMSMDSGILALARTFAAGHVYVGLSRLRSPEGLVLTDRDFDVHVDPIVMEFYRSIRESTCLTVP